MESFLWFLGGLVIMGIIMLQAVKGGIQAALHENEDQLISIIQRALEADRINQES